MDQTVDHKPYLSPYYKVYLPSPILVQAGSPEFPPVEEAQVMVKMMDGEDMGVIQ